MTVCTRPDHYPQPDGPGELDSHLHAAGTVIAGSDGVVVVDRTPCELSAAPDSAYALALPVYEHAGIALYHGDCVEVMRGSMGAETINAIVTDPPYGLEFMGKEWDKLARPKPGNLGGFANGDKPSFERVRRYLPQMQAWHERWAIEALRVLKPGGYLLAFGGTRTFHRLTCGIEDAGFEIRDCIADFSMLDGRAATFIASLTDDQRGELSRLIDRGFDGGVLAWVFGSGFPKSLNIGGGRGTALKPGWEPCVVARKPLRGTVAANVERYGTGALNIDACRIEHADETDRRKSIPGGRITSKARHVGAEPDAGNDEDRSEFEPSAFKRYAENGGTNIAALPGVRGGDTAGRWPANVMLDEEAAALLDAESGQRGGSGGPSRFFYTAKASRSEREAWGRMTLAARRRVDAETRKDDAAGSTNPRLRTSARINDHPTVKPLALMEWLLKLAVPPGGLVLDPFAGSGSTLVAARRLNIRAIGIEQDARSVEISRQRIEAQWEIRLV